MSPRLCALQFLTRGQQRLPVPEGPPTLSLSSLVGRVCSKPEQERSLDPTSMGALFVGGWGRETEVGQTGAGAGWEDGLPSLSLVSCGYCEPRHRGTATAGHMLRRVCWGRGVVNLPQPLPFRCPQLTLATPPAPSVMVGQGSEYCLLQRPLQLHSSSWS